MDVGDNSDRGHDYEFDWDYETIDPGPEWRQLVEKISSHIWSDTKISFTVGFVQGLDESMLGKYVDGTSSHPMVVLDPRNIQYACANYRVSLETAIETTIMHELAHAMEEKYEFEHDENVAEEFAWLYNTKGEVWKFWEEEI